MGGLMGERWAYGGERVAEGVVLLLDDLGEPVQEGLPLRLVQAGQELAQLHRAQRHTTRHDTTRQFAGAKRRGGKGVLPTCGLAVYFSMTSAVLAASTGTTCMQRT